MRVLGLGDNVVDRYVNKHVMFPGGNAVNFAVYAQKSGTEASYLGCFGDDMEADHIIAALQELEIGLERCRRILGTTTERCDVNLVEGDRVFVGDDLRESKVDSICLNEKDLKLLGTFDLVHSGCYASMDKEMVKLKDLPGIVTFDFSVEEEFKEDAFLEKICPYIDMALFSCEGMEEEEIRELQKKVYQLGTRYVLITKGTEGQILYDGREYHKGVVKLVEAVDTMGAGDSFFTSFVVSLLKQGWKKGGQLKREMIQSAFETAAQFSADNCLVDGAFGFAKEI